MNPINKRALDAAERAKNQKPVGKAGIKLLKTKQLIKSKQPPTMPCNDCAWNSKPGEEVCKHCSWGSKYKKKEPVTQTPDSVQKD